MALEPATGGEVCGYAGCEQREADGEGACGPAEFYAAFEHEAVEEGQDEDQHCRFGEEGRAAVGGDGDQFDEWGRPLCRGGAST